MKSKRLLELNDNSITSPTGLNGELKYQFGRDNTPVIGWWDRGNSVAGPLGADKRHFK
jgi:hypothetical protein